MVAITKEECIGRFLSINKGRYKYDKVEYVNTKTHVIITCRIHGDFRQMPYKHYSGEQCRKCSMVTMGRKARIKRPIFISTANKIHKNKYDYSLVGELVHSKKIKIICPIHGVFEKRYHAHLRGEGCIKCAYIKSNSNSQDYFIKKSNDKHGSKYDYSVSEYSGVHKKVKIICPDHGVFEQEAGAHMAGCGCTACFLDSIRGKSTYTKIGYLKLTKHKKSSRLYLLKIDGNGEEFYKVGITCTDIRKRFEASKFPHDVYNISIIAEFSGDKGFIWDLETICHRANRHLKYKPKIKFGGYTECFSGLSSEMMIIIHEKLYNGSISI